MAVEAAVVVAAIGAAAAEGGLEGACEHADCPGLLQPWVLVHDLRLR